MAQQSPPLLSPGSRIAGYEVGVLVGRGGMGEVYRAKQISMQREVALKILSPRLARTDPAFADQFVAEARAAGKLNHPNIVGVHDVGEAPAPDGCSGVEPGTPIHYFSMEFIDGETVKDVIERQGAMDIPTIGKVMAAMAEALAFAEQHKIVHRDIKPDNIMLTSGGGVKLADLGLALQADSAEAVAGSKDEQGRGKVMGTPLYMAPEQARAQPIDHRADQYALGATLFHMLTGSPPYQGESSKAIMRAHCFEAVPDPAETNPQVPPPWRDLCLRMMAKQPAERFAGAAELRAA
ncbi:MAG: serine/threonine protein kinase, partial [Planctomycetes bacterium]|nr:serine/threonine protein kinase [Planctomycetota bacterium]